VNQSGLIRKVAVLAVGLVSSLLVGTQSAHADSSLPPVVVSFTMSPSSVDIATTKNVVTFDLVVSSPTGIVSTQSMTTFTNGSNSSLATSLTRVDNPVNNSLTTVEFKGTLTLPSNLIPGVYTASTTPVFAYNSSGTTGYPTPIITATSSSTLIGALNAVQVRAGGNLNLNYATFVGPSFNTLKGNIFSDPKYYAAPAPVWKVGEVLTPSTYYQLNVPTLTLKVKTSTPSICSTDGTVLTLVAIGSCGFTVYTDQTADYLYQHDDENVTISAARIKPTYAVGNIATQSSAVLPLSIAGPFINGPVGLVTPVSATPTICYPVGTYITVISGGTCTLNYSSPASSTYAASDIFPLTFEITRSSQTVSFVAPTSVALSAKTLILSASATSKAPVIFQSDSPVICSVTGNSLNLLKAGSCQVEAIQAGTTTISPASTVQSIMVTGSLVPTIRKIVCVKNGKSKTFTGTKCPVGYKVKK
jgi:hypothetical protein